MYKRKYLEFITFLQQMLHAFVNKTRNLARVQDLHANSLDRRDAQSVDVANTKLDNNVYSIFTVQLINTWS